MNKSGIKWGSFTLRIPFIHTKLLTAEFLQSIGMGGGEDPLVAIREKELELRDKELDIDQQQFEQKQDQRIQTAMGLTIHHRPRYSCSQQHQQHSTMN